MLAVCLACGLYIAHVFIPPTPGPIAAAQTMGIGENLLLVIGFGVLCSVFPLTAGYFYACYIGSRIHSSEETEDTSVVQTYEELKASYGILPSVWSSFSPLIIPILLMAVSSVSSMMGWTGTWAEFFAFCGTPIMALAVGTILGIILLAQNGKSKELFKMTNDTLMTVGPILFVTAAGSVLGKVIASSDLMGYITEHATLLETLGVFFPFLISALFKSAQGSSTVAITTTAGLIAPLLPVLGFVSPQEITLAVMAIGAGAMTVSHANDSFFWVVTNFSGLTVENGYKTQTMLTLVIGLASIFGIFLLSLVV